MLLEVAKLLRERRRARGALDFELPEAKVRVDDESGHPIDIERSRKDPGVARAYGMIEELMLLANEVVAQDLQRARRCPRSTACTACARSGAPRDLRALAKALGFALSTPTSPNTRRSSRASWPACRARRTRRALGYLLLRSMQQATYDIENIGHFGLAAEHYLHFTSPIRRYPDLAVHRVVRSVARGERIESWGLGQRLKLQAEPVEPARAARDGDRARGGRPVPRLPDARPGRRDLRRDDQRA